jgi:hypothetical protein
VLKLLRKLVGLSLQALNPLVQHEVLELLWLFLAGVTAVDMLTTT